MTLMLGCGVCTANLLYVFLCMLFCNKLGTYMNSRLLFFDPSFTLWSSNLLGLLLFKANSPFLLLYSACLLRDGKLGPAGAFLVERGIKTRKITRVPLEK